MWLSADTLLRVNRKSGVTNVNARFNQLKTVRSFLSNRTVAIALSVFLNVAGFTIILPVVPFLVGRYVPSDQIGLYVGLIVSVYALCAFCAAPVLGALSDRYGRRPVLILSLLGSTVGYLVFGFGGALWVLFLGRIVDGLTAGNISTVYAYVADTHRPEERGHIYGMLGATAGLGFMLGRSPAVRWARFPRPHLCSRPQG